MQRINQIEYQKKLYTRQNAPINWNINALFPNLIVYWRHKGQVQISAASIAKPARLVGGIQKGRELRNSICYAHIGRSKGSLDPAPNIDLAFQPRKGSLHFRDFQLDLAMRKIFCLHFPHHGHRTGVAVEELVSLP